MSSNAKAAGEVAVVNSSDRYALIAVQGPKARAIVQPLTAVRSTPSSTYWFAHGEVAGVRGTVSRTGYTGEDGYEIFVPPQFAPPLWSALLQAGKDHGLVPCGLGARDTLRLEAAMRLYGNDIDETTTVVEGDLGWIVGWNKPAFLGHEVLRKQKADGPDAQDRRLRDGGAAGHRPPGLRRAATTAPRSARSPAARRRRS